MREQEEERQRKAEKDKREAETNARNEKRKSAEVDGPEDLSKRRRISEETYARYGLPSPTKKAEAPKSPAADTEQQVRSAAGVEERTATSSKVTSQNKTRSGKARESNQVISLDSDDDDDEPTIVGTKRSSPPPEDSDEEFPELVALARERRRKREAEAKASKSATVPLKAVATVSPPENDPVLKLLITSPLPSTKPLLVHRRLSQRLMEIRLAWCQRQGFSDSDTQNVFLTYKMRRVYDVTTCKSLGIKVDAAGNVIGDRPSNVFQTEDDGDAGRIHLIAVTEAVFEELKRQKEAEKAAKVVMPTIEPDEAPASSTQSKSEDQKIRILIKAKGFNDYKLIVRPVSQNRYLHLDFSHLTAISDHDLRPHNRCIPQREQHSYRKAPRISLRWRGLAARG